MRLKLTFIFALFLTISCATNDHSKEKADLHLRIGTSYMSNGDYPQAMRELTLAESLDPDNAVIQNNLALSYFVRERYEDAEKHLTKAISLDPKYTEAKNNLGRVYIELGKYSEAIDILREVTQDLTYPEPEKGFYNLGYAYYKKNDILEAKENFMKTLKISRTFCPAHNYYGQTLYLLKDYQRASSALESALHICKNLEEAHYYSGLSFLKLGQRSKGRGRLEEVIELYPKSKWAQKARALLKTTE